MRQNVINLEKFYATRLGLAARNMAMRRLETVWPDLSGKEVLAFGYGFPFVETYSSQCKRLILAMPGDQGAIAQKSQRCIISCLVEEDLLPFDDAQFAHIVVAHGLEESGMIEDLLSELWRITKPEGRVIIIAPNRAGLWARSDKSPFGSGRPFSRNQLKGLLRQVGYEPVFWSGALYAPPIKLFTTPTWLKIFERFGETVWPGLSGLILVEAIKRLYAEPSGLKTQKVSRPVFGTAPLGKTATGNTASRQ